MLRAHEKLIILGTFVRSVRVSTPLQSSQVFFFAEDFCHDFCTLFYLKYVFYHPLNDVTVLTVAAVLHALQVVNKTWLRVTQLLSHTAYALPLTFWEERPLTKGRKRGCCGR